MKRHFLLLTCLPCLAALAAAGSGCGSGAALPSAIATSAPGAVPSGGPSPTWSPTGTPSYNFHFEVTGQGTSTQVSNGQALIVSTGSLLQVTLTAGSTMPLSGTGYTVGFNCEWFNVQVGQDVQQAFVKRQGYTDVPLINGWMDYDPCAAAETSWSYDFSSALGSNGGNAQVIVSEAQFDNCADYFNDPPSFIGVDNGGCPSGTVPGNYSVDGFLQVYTN